MKRIRWTRASSTEWTSEAGTITDRGPTKLVPRLEAKHSVGMPATAKLDMRFRLVTPDSRSRIYASRREAQRMAAMLLPEVVA